MPFAGCHVFGMAFQTEVFDLHYACAAVGAEYESEYLRDEIVELFAAGWICELSTVGAA